MKHEPATPETTPLTRAEKRRLAEDRRTASMWRVWNAKTEADQDFDYLRSLALEKAAFAIGAILRREGIDRIAAGPIADAALTAIEAAMKRGTVNGKPSI